jgi:error-prone DNA polymerase
VAEDYKALRLSLKAHPMALLRERIARAGYVPARRLLTLAANKRVDVAGIVLVRQQPGTASGVIFATLEDETGVANIIIWPKVFARFRRTVLGSSLLGVRGTLQREGIVIHVVAEKLVDLSHLLRALGRCDGTSASADSEGVVDELTTTDLKIAPSPPDHFKRPPPEKPRLVPDATRSLPDPSRRIARRDPNFPSRDFR